MYLLPDEQRWVRQLHGQDEHSQFVGNTYCEHDGEFDGDEVLHTHSHTLSHARWLSVYLWRCCGRIWSHFDVGRYV